MHITPPFWCRPLSERRSLAVAFGSVLPVVDVDHLVEDASCAVLYHPCASYPKQQILAAAFGSSLSAAVVDHSVEGVRCIVLHLLVPATSSDGRLLQHSVLCFLLRILTITPRVCCAQYFAFFVSVTPNKGSLPQLLVSHFCCGCSPFCPRRAECFNDWGGRGYDDSFPANSTNKKLPGIS